MNADNDGEEGNGKQCRFFHPQSVAPELSVSICVYLWFQPLPPFLLSRSFAVAVVAVSYAAPLFPAVLCALCVLCGSN
jgi:hypothetical protein